MVDLGSFKSKFLLGIAVYRRKTRFVDCKLRLLASAVPLDYANYFQFTGDSDYLFSSLFNAMIAYIMPILIGNCRLSSNNLEIIASLIAQSNFLFILV